MNEFTYTSTHESGNKIQVNPDEYKVSVTNGAGNGHYITLPPDLVVDMSITLLSSQYSAVENYDGTITLTPKGLPVPTNPQAVVRTAHGIAVLADKHGPGDLKWVVAKPDGTSGRERHPGVVLEIIHPGIEG